MNILDPGCCRQPATPASHRRDGDTAVRSRDAAQLHPRRRTVRDLSGSLAGHGDGRGGAALSGRAVRAGRASADHEQHRIGAAVLLHADARPAGPVAQAGSDTARMRKLPVVLSQEEVARLLDATTCLKHQAALSVAYGAGLRAAEVAALKVRDIDSERMLAPGRARQGRTVPQRHAPGPVCWRCCGSGGRWDGSRA